MVKYKDFSLNVHTQAEHTRTVVNAQIELTYGCNLHCVHCYTDCYNRPDLLKQELSYEEVTRILDQLAAEGCLWVCFTGGEIFMRKDFLEIYAYAKRKGFLITLFTNGTLFTEAIADYLKEHPPFSIEISCHGATEETFDRITQVKGSFQRFLKGIRLLTERGLPIKIKTKAMTVNQHELDQIKAFVEGLGTQFRLSTIIYPRLNGDLTPAAYRLSPDEIVALESQEGGSDQEDRCTEAEIEIGPPADDRLFRCGCGTTAVHINAWGQLGTCTWVTERADLRQTTVADAVRQVFPRIRAARYQGESPCRTCHVHTFCDKMPANAAAEAGDREQPVEHFCRVAYQRAHLMGIPGECPVGLREEEGKRYTFNVNRADH
jgi:radical SAM protein with 4Fe4S-binding SPASM domain